MNKAIAAVVAVLILAGVAWYFLRPKEAPPAPPPPAAQPVAQKPADAPLPSTAESDDLVRKQLLGVSPQLSKWLSEGALLERWVVVMDNLGEDVSPRKMLDFLAPAGKFRATAKNEIDVRSYQRYDLFAEVVQSVDAKAFAAAVRALHPLLESAYHKLGYPDRKLDDAAQKALQRLAGAPVAEGAVKLVPKGALYRFADEKLEAQGAVEKHLLRMGPRNTKLIQAKAREIAAALGLSLATR
jgi:DUF3014 family protein